MFELFDYLERLAANPGDQQVWITILAAVLIFAFAISMMFFFVGLMNPIRRRLRKLSESKEKEKVKESLKREGELFKGVEKKLGALNDYILPKNIEESSRIRAKLMQAGFRSQNAIFLFFGIKTILAVLLPLIYFVAATTTGLQEVKPAMYFSVAVMGLVYFFLM